MIRAPGRLRLELQHQAPASAPPLSRWTLELLNQESVAGLRDMCRVQGIIVSPSRGSACTKADYVAALLADRDTGLEPSEEQQSDAQHEASDHAIADDFRELSDHHDDCNLDSALHGAEPFRAGLTTSSLQYLPPQVWQTLPAVQIQTAMSWQ